MLLSADPLLQRPPVNVLPTTYTGLPWCWESARTAAPPRSGPVLSQRLSTEHRVHDLEPAAAHEDRPAAPAVVGLTGRVAVGERQVLEDQPRRRLVVAVVGGPGLLRVAGVLVEDAALAAAAERDEAAAVDDHALAGVDDLRGLLEHDRHRVGAAAEPDDPALGHRAYDGPRGAAARRAVADPAVGDGGVDRTGLLRHRDRFARIGVRRRRAGPGGGASGGARNADRPRVHRSPVTHGTDTRCTGRSHAVWCLCWIRQPDRGRRGGAASAAPRARAGAPARRRCRAWRRCRPACAGDRR